MKNIVFHILVGLIPFCAFGQGSASGVFTVITDGSWEQRMLPLLTYNSAPVSGNALNGGTWGGVIVKNNYLADCGIQWNYEKPGDIITVAHPNQCDYTNTTTFFRKTFTIPSGFSNFCDIFIKVRADDAFRVYVNGTNIPSAPGAPYSSGCFGGNSAIIGMNYTTVFNVPVPSNLLNFGGTNTIIFEVQNCGIQTPDLCYVTAAFNIRRNLDPSEADFQHSVVPIGNGVSQVTFAPLSSAKDDKMRQIQSLGWTIEQGTSQNGPFIPLLTNNVDRVLITNLPNCFFYRVTRTITNGCSTVSFSKIIFFCNGEFGPTGDPEEWLMISPGNYATRGIGYVNPSLDNMDREIIDEGEQIKYVDDITIAPNPANGYLNVTHQSDHLSLEVFSMLGQMVMQKNIGQETSVDLSEIINEGIYLLQFRDSSNGKLYPTQKLIIKR